jgi:hypothetical protein
VDYWHCTPPPAVATSIAATRKEGTYGYPVTWTVSATSGIQPLQYEFWRYCYANPGWQLVQPYSTSPSHRLFRGVLDRVLAPEEYQLLIFGTCGVVPAELERMYPFAHYRYMLGNVHDERVRRDFLEIETDRLATFLTATRGLYERRAAYCIGLFREAMVRAVAQSGVRLDLLLPSEPSIRACDPTALSRGSLSRAMRASSRRDRRARPLTPWILPSVRQGGEDGVLYPTLQEWCPVDRSVISSGRSFHHHAQ